MLHLPVLALLRNVGANDEDTHEGDHGLPPLDSIVDRLGEQLHTKMYDVDGSPK
ncbi:hypothetical protein [Pseudomonas phage TC6]|uniref:Uncharacterized protein n=1 Tax=Pseudomonas phage TC6 TaxID=2060947 RepID=A0A2H5BQF9_9CAUD|nr:hypothetical protein [Pseudomonas phage TC6]